MIISLNTIFSPVSLEYRVLLGIILLLSISRIQLKMNPYKLEENNDIEVMSILAGMLILYCGIIFEQGQDYNYPIFNLIAMLILIVFNSVFLIRWLYYFLDSFNFKNKNLRMFVMLYGLMLCKNKNSKETETDLDIDEVQQINAVKNIEINDEDQKVNSMKSSSVNSR